MILIKFLKLIQYLQHLSPQGKYLFEFFVISTDDGYFGMRGNLSDLIDYLSKYKIRSKVEIKDDQLIT